MSGISVRIPWIIFDARTISKKNLKWLSKAIAREFLLKCLLVCEKKNHLRKSNRNSWNNEEVSRDIS